MRPLASLRGLVLVSLSLEMQLRGVPAIERRFALTRFLVLRPARWEAVA
jgi:hypothetical protein